MALRPEEVAELSRLLDEALALDAAQREPWLAALHEARPEVARRLSAMLVQSAALATESLPRLPKAADDEAVAAAGERVGPYLLVREIGRGGMGSVWLADRADGAFKRRLALKLPRLTWSAGLAKRMARERDIGALLEHPNIARLYDAGLDEHGRPYIAMEYIDGQPIDVYCREHALDVPTRLKLFVQVAQAVAYAHGRLVLHRDLKPSNVLIDASGHAHLLDFGIAKLLDDTPGSDLTQEQGRVLTLSYAAPEHIAGRPIGVTADVYALGVMLYELLTATLPFTSQRRTPGALEDAILAGDAPMPSSRANDSRTARKLRGDLDAIVGKAIKRDPNERYQTAETLAADIQRYLDGHAIEARPDSAWYRLRKAAVRHKMPVLAASAVLVVALIGLTTTAIQGRKAYEEAERAAVATAFVAELFRVDPSQPPLMDGASSRPTQAVLLERGAKLIEDRFERQPALRASLYGAFGRAYVDLGQYQLAIQFANRQLQILREQDSQAPSMAPSLLLLSEAALAAGRDVDAEEYARQATNVLPLGDPLRADAFALLARAQVSNGKLQLAAQTVAEGKASERQRGSHGALGAAWLIWVDGELLLRQNRFEDARPIMLEAIDRAQSAEGVTSGAAFQMRIRLAEYLLNRNRPDESRRIAGHAFRDFGDQGELQRIRSVRAKVLLLEREFTEGYADYVETTSAMTQVKEFLLRQASVVPAELLAEHDFTQARIHLAYQDFAKAEPLLISSAPLLKASSQSLWQKFVIASISGLCQMSVGDHPAADVSLREALEIWIQLGLGNLPFTAGVWGDIVTNLIMQGRIDKAEALLAKAPTFSAQGDKDAAIYEDILPLLGVWMRLDAGNVEGARKALPARLGAITENYPIQEKWTNFPVYWIYGAFLCAASDARTGLSHLVTAQEALSHHVSQHAPELARLRAVTGLCALSLGHRKQAEMLSVQARLAFDAQPRVSPYFKKPLKELEQRLGKYTM